MRRESPPFFLEVNGWVQLHSIVAIPVIVHVKTYMSLRLEYSTLHVHVRVHYTLYIQPILCTNNNKQSQMVSFMRRESSPFFLEVNCWVQLYGIVAML